MKRQSEKREEEGEISAKKKSLITQHTDFVLGEWRK